MTKLLRTALYAASAATLALLATAVPAHAEDPAPPDGNISPSPDDAPEPEAEDETGADLSVEVASGASTSDNNIKFIQVAVHNDGPDTATGVSLDFVVEDYAYPEVEIEPNFNTAYKCETHDDTGSSKTITCPLDDIVAGGTNGEATFLFAHSPGDAPAVVGEGHVTVSSDVTETYPDDNTAPYTLTITEPGVDMSAWAPNDITLTPGETAAFGGREFLKAVNESYTKVKGVSFSVVLPTYATFEPEFDNCTYTDDLHKMNCELPDVELKGSQYGLILFTEATPVHITAAANAPGPVSLGRAQLTVAAMGVLSELAVAGGDERAEAQTFAVPEDRVPGDNDTEFSVLTTENEADLYVTAEKAKGEAGDTVEIPFTVGNKGPADTRDFVTVMITVPDGTTWAGGPVDSDGKDLCWGTEHNDVYGCEWGFFGPDTAVDAAFKVKITDADVKDGELRVVESHFEKDTENNVAAVVVDTPGGGSGGGTGSEDGLPVTGRNLTIAGIAALVLLVVGGGLVLATRKKATAAGPVHDDDALAAEEDGEDADGAGDDADVEDSR